MYLPKEEEVGKEDYGVVKTVYNLNRKEYQQDVYIETYLVSRLNEFYLDKVEETINKVEDCVLGVSSGNECVFFGMQIQKADGETGGLGASMNAYIVTTIYDRLLRIVEDLTTLEAFYRSAQQLDYVDPIQESNAQEYTKQEYQFAYVNTKDYSQAKMFGSERIGKSECKDSDKRKCPKVNNAPSTGSSIEDTEILKRLDPINDLINEARSIHNIKYELSDYKLDYRKYLKSIEIHQRTLKALTDSDKCVINFINRHKKNADDNAKEMWLGDSSWNHKANEHHLRKGLSKDLILKYQEDKTDKLIGTSAKCADFYEEGACPDGYVTELNSPCEEDNTLFACVIDSITADTEQALSDTRPEITVDVDEEPNEDEIANKHPSEGVVDLSAIDKVELENRKNTESNWQLGYNLLMDNISKFKFAKWVDQAELQKEYLRNKYRNIRMILNSVDMADSSYRISRSITDNYTDEKSYDDGKEPIEKLVNKLTSLKTPEEAVSDGSAIRYAKSKGLCNGYNSYNASKKQYTKEVITTWKEAKHYVKSNGTPGIYYIDKHSRMEVACYAEVSPSLGYIDIMVEEYVPNTKDTTVTNRDSKKIDLRIRDSKASYKAKFGDKFVESFYKEPSNIKNLIASGSEGTSTDCAGTWNFTVNFIVRKFFPVALGKCGNTMDKEVANFYNLSKTNGRVIAKDKRDVVQATRVSENQKMTIRIAKYNQEKQLLNDKMDTIGKNRKKWSEIVDTATKNKNDIIGRLSSSKGVVKTLETENESLRKEIKSMEEDIKQGKENLQVNVDINNEKIALNLFNIERISTYSTKEYPLCTKLETSKKSKICVQSDEDGEKYITFIYANNKIKQYNETIDSYNQRLESSKDDILALEEDIKELASDFTEDYLELAEKSQDNIERANKEYEELLEYSDDGDNIRMEGKRDDHDSNDLSSTILLVLDNGKNIKNKKLEDSNFIKNSIKDKWFTNSQLSSYGSKLTNMLGLPQKMVVSEKLNIGGGQFVDTGTLVANEVIKKIRDNIIDLAAQRIAETINKTDHIIKSELDDAVKSVNKWAGDKLCVLGEGEEYVGEGNCSVDYMDHSLYGDNSETATVTKGHKEMIQSIITPSAQNRQYLSDANIDLRSIFGVIDDDDITTDSEYFVALPARGLYSEPTEKQCVYGDDTKNHDGCDYKSPKAPLMNIPPLRESFYFGNYEYDDIPRSKKKEPAISDLLNRKYSDETIEYMPEVWRYLLARPNLRNDGKYQQTFTERSYDTTRLLKYIDKFDDDEVQITIDRGGVYPCRLYAGGPVIDVENEDRPQDMMYVKNKALNVTNICKDISAYKNYVQHNLADFDANKNDNKNKGIQKLSKTRSTPLYNNLSELAQFLRKSGKRLVYRDPVFRTNEYMLDTKNSKNSLQRQMGETVLYKNNVLGRFLNVVKIENLAKKNMDINKEVLTETLSRLCSMIHENNLVISDREKELEGEEKTKTCVDYIMSTNGLASSSSDEKELVDKDCNKSSSSKDIYHTIFCSLNTAKAQKLSQARKDFAQISKEFKPRDIARVKEHLDKIEGQIKALELDSNEDMEIRPGDDTSIVTKDAIAQSKANKAANLAIAKEGLQSMDNQTRAAPYCPLY